MLCCTLLMRLFHSNCILDLCTHENSQGFIACHLAVVYTQSFFTFFFWSKSQFGPLYGWVRHLDFSFCGCMRVCELQKCACARLLCVNGAATLTLWIVKGPHCRFLHILDNWLNVVMQDPAGTLWKTAPNSVWTVDWKWSLLQLHYHIHDDVITLIKNVWRHGTWKFSHKASTLIMSNKNWARGGGK